MSWEENIFFFVLFGISGIALEVFITAIQNLKNKKDKCLVGTSSIWTFFIYGFSFFAVLFVTTYFPDINLFVKGFIYTLLFYILEFCSGTVLKKCRTMPADSSVETKHPLIRVIRFKFIPVWFIGGLFAEAVYTFLNMHMIL
jgi:hypothetical protein